MDPRLRGDDRLTRGDDKTGMRKDLLLKAIQNYEAKLKTGEAENYRITALKQFLETENIKKLNPDQDISIYDFAKFASFTLDNPADFLSPSFLSNKQDRVARIMNYLLDSSPVVRNDENDALLGSLGHIPKEVMETEIPKHLSDEDIAYLAESSSAFYESTKKASYWRDKLLDKFIDKGWDPDLLKNLEDTHTVQDYKGLYEAVTRLPRTIKITEHWQLLCLSGETRALHLVFSLADQIIVEKGELGIIHFAYFSGKIPAIEACHQHGLFAQSTQEAIKLFNIAAQSGSIPAINYLFDHPEFKKLLMFETWNLTNKHDFFTCAIQSKNKAAVEHAIQLCDRNRGPYETVFAKKMNKQAMLRTAAKDSTPAIIRYILKLLDEYPYEDREFNITSLRLALSDAVESANVPALRYLLEEVPKRNIPLISIISFDRLLDKSVTARCIPAISIFEILYTELGMSLDSEAKNSDIDVNILSADVLRPSSTNILHLAVSTGDLAVIKHVWDICSRHNIDPTALTDNGENLLHLTAESGSVAAVIFVRKKCEEVGLDISPDAVTPMGASAIDVARDNMYTPNINDLVNALTKPLAELEQTTQLKR
jgi:hypothetical protein